jgi:hypothetical protein
MPTGGNLYLQVTVGKDGSINRSWIFRYFDSARHDLGLGPLHTILLADARERALELRKTTQGRPSAIYCPLGRLTVGRDFIDFDLAQLEVLGNQPEKRRNFH